MIDIPSIFIKNKNRVERDKKYLYTVSNNNTNQTTIETIIVVGGNRKVLIENRPCQNP